MAWSKADLDFEKINHQQLLFKLLSGVQLFSSFTRGELAEFLSGAEKRVYPKGEQILREGDPGAFMYVIIAGNVEIRKSLRPGEAASLARLGAGECFGEMALVDQELRSASVVAITDCTLLRLAGDALLAVPQASMKFYRNIAFLLSQRLRQTNLMISLGMTEPQA